MADFMPADQTGPASLSSQDRIFLSGKHSFGSPTFSKLLILMKSVGSGLTPALRAVQNAGRMDKLQFINTGLVPLDYTNFVFLGNCEKNLRERDNANTSCIKISFKNGTSPGTTGMAFGTQGKEEKPFAVSVKMTAGILERKPGSGFSNW